MTFSVKYSLLGKKNTSCNIEYGFVETADLHQD